MQKNATFLFQNCDLWSISKGDRWNFTGELFKVSQKFGTTDEAQNFWIKKKKNEQHRIMEDRISIQKQKTATF